MSKTIKGEYSIATMTPISGSPEMFQAGSLERQKAILVLKAKLRYGYILPVRGKCDLRDCFTLTATRLIFWFNTSSNNTRIMTTKISAA